VSELFGCWDESALQIESAPVTRAEPLALPPAPPSLVRQRSVLLAGAAVVIVIGLSTVIAVTGGFKSNEATATALPPSQIQPAPVAAPAEVPKAVDSTATVKPGRPATERREEKRTQSKAVAETEAPQASQEEPEPKAQAIRVVMQIENGRVLKASIANSKPGMDSYEAMALRIARQRRYPATMNGGETVTITVNR
jgi:hypothetical protein